MSLYLLRHTTPKFAAGVCYGRTDLDLADSFEDEAAAALRSVPPVETIVTSPLARCRRLAERIAEARTLPLATDARFQEMDFGAWEGVRWDDIPREELDAWAADFLNARPHGGESVAILRARVADGLADLAAHGVPALVVTHAGVIKCALATGPGPDDFSVSVAFGGVVALPRDCPATGE